MSLEITSGRGIMIALKNILVATDFGAAAEAALLYGRALARAFGATLHVLHIPEGIYLDTIGSERYMGSPPIGLRSEIEEAARKRLEALVVVDNDPRPIPTTPAVVMSIAPAQAIIAYAKDENLDLIVMGSHGRRGASHLLRGSVAERVVRNATCPVLTVHHPEHEFVVPDAVLWSPPLAGEDFHTPWDCRWMRVGQRVVLPEKDQAEGVWVCARPPGPTRSVTEAECARCEFSEPAND